MKPRAETFLSAAFTFVAAWAVFEASDWPFSARLFPWLAGIPLLFISVLLLVINLFSLVSKAGEALDFKFSENVEPAVARSRALNILAWLVGFTAALWVLGFHAAIPLVVFAYLRYQGRERWSLSLSLSAVAYLFFWGLFDKLMNLPIPEARFLIWLEKLVG